jgi:hypothetical protein
MSFRLFIYYCALCGAGGALVGWGLGRLLGAPNTVVGQGLKGLWLGVGVALMLGLVDALWSLSLRQVLSVWARVAVAVLIGAVGGFLGGAVGQALYSRLTWAACLVVGWTFLGLLVGLSLGAFDLLACVLRGQGPRGALRKVLNGVIGGVVGGALGGTLSVLLRGAWGGLFEGRDADLLWAPSASGFVALGMCIGLLIGLAQVILKEAWVKVESGFRPGRELILSKPEVVIGRAEGCDIGLFGDNSVEHDHAHIRREGREHVLIDMGSAAGTYVNGERVLAPRPLRSGDSIRLGRCVLRFGERPRRSRQ